MNEMAVISEKYLWQACPGIGFTKKNLDDFLRWAVELKANDIMIESNEPLGIKKDNETFNVTTRAITYNEVSQLINDIYQTSAQSQLRTGKPFGFAYAFSFGKDEKLRFRVDASAGNSINAIDEGIELVFRPTDGEPDSVDELGINPRIVETTNLTKGMVIITGPTGSGKTTMIASLLKHIIQTMRLHVLSIEDPIEFDFKQIPKRLSRVMQSELVTNVTSFAKFIKHMLRRSPDVVLLGELRDAESIDAGILVAQTGHLVYATGHTDGCANAMERLVDDLPTQEQRSKLAKLVTSTQAIIHQRLLDKRGGGRVPVCEELYITSDLRMQMYSVIAKETESLTAFLEKHIASTGLSIKDAIKAKFTIGVVSIETCIAELSQQLSKNDFLFFNDKCYELQEKGLISTEERNKWLSYIKVYSENLR